MAKVLLVERDNSLREMYSQLIGGAGYDVVGFENTQPTIEALRKTRPVAMVLDGSKGEILTLILQIRKYPNVAIATTPILVLVDNKESKTEYITVGANKCLPKFPTSGEVLVRNLKSILNIPSGGK